MSYTKKTWENLPDTTTPVNATGMNDLETRIDTGLKDALNGTTRITDFDTTMNAGVYQFVSTTSNVPSGLTTPYGNLIVTKTTVGSAIYIQQIAIDNKGGMVERSWNPSTNLWRPWINVAIDTGWVTPTLDSNFEVYTSSYQFRYRRINDVVYIQGCVKAKEAIATSDSITQRKVITLPTELRPAHVVTFTSRANGKNTFQTVINSVGQVYVERYGITTEETIPANTALYINLCYVLG